MKIIVTLIITTAICTLAYANTVHSAEVIISKIDLFKWALTASWTIITGFGVLIGIFIRRSLSEILKKIDKLFEYREEDKKEVDKIGDELLVLQTEHQICKCRK